MVSATSSTSSIDYNSSLIPTTMPADYKDRCKQVFEKSVNLPKDEQLKPFSSLLFMNVEMLPTINDENNYDDNLDGNNVAETNEKMIKCGLDVMKRVYYEINGNPVTSAILIKDDENGVIYQLRKGVFKKISLNPKLSEKLYLATGLEVDYNGYEVFSRIFFNFSPAVRSSVLHSCLTDYMPAVVIRMVDDYTGVLRSDEIMKTLLIFNDATSE